MRVVKFYVLRVGLWFTLYIMVGGYVMVNYVVVSVSLLIFFWSVVESRSSLFVLIKMLCQV